ncbi:Protein of unknown function [Streptomyces sp. WMMB 714]|uniref:DUF3140 domain-containing protein n=1 Tax=Streptomyces sp. WMMB 714 TaxID=1286822 RepID=UPI0005F85236|nr:DUF3140 domain-containing protein [Streptomyces sp. WMMB 714]SCK51526.1 Protein of unknown function [Streptomyces sp. WMMB 714]
MSDTEQRTQREQLFTDFEKSVNMPAGQLERWLATSESRNVGRHKGQSESHGHAAGRRIVRLLRTRRADFTADDLVHMRRAVRHIERQLRHRPRGDVSDTAWRFSLMNWGHDPQRHDQAR